MKLKKKDRHQALITLLDDDPFITDEDIAKRFDVSIQTVRLDRMELNIPEYRERVKTLATKRYDGILSISKSDIVGELIDLTRNQSAISYLEADASMAFANTDVIKGHYIFAMAESLALAVVTAKVALTGIANVKYQKPVRIGDKLVAKAVVKQIEGASYYVHIRILTQGVEVFRSKFKLSAVEANDEDSN